MAAMLIWILFQNSVLICCLNSYTFRPSSVTAVTIQTVKGDVRIMPSIRIILMEETVSKVLELFFTDPVLI